MFKKIILLLALSLSIYVVSASHALAAKAVFPNSSKLEPIPVYVYPAISANVNATSTPSYENTGVQSQTFAPAGTGQYEPNTSTTSDIQNGATSVPSRSFFWPIVYVVLALVIVSTPIIFFWLF